MEHKSGDNPATRAFVVQFGSGTDPERNFYSGRVEQVSSGKTLRFEDLDGLLRFLATALKGTEELAK